MESPEAITIVILLVIGLVWLSRQSRGAGSARDSESKQREDSLAPTGGLNVTRSLVEPFEAVTSKPVAEPSILRGAAYVIDGDSIVIQKTQIRLFGVDAPELNHPYGQKAKWALAKLCKGMTVNAEILERDAHGRTVAKCTLSDGRDLSAEMVKLGLAIDWPKFSRGVYRALEVDGIRKKLWLADARQKGRMHVWREFEERQRSKSG